MENPTQRSTRCWVPKGGYPTGDGYLRVLIHQRKFGGLLKMWHRLVYEIVNGEIPEGYEVNHLCKNRSCCNPEHLELLTRSEHRTKDNTGRYQDRRDKIYKAHLDNPEFSQYKLARMFGVSQSAVSKILKEMRGN